MFVYQLNYAKNAYSYAIVIRLAEWIENGYEIKFWTTFGQNPQNSTLTTYHLGDVPLLLLLLLSASLYVSKRGAY